MLKLVTEEVKHTIKYMGAKFEVVPMTKEQDDAVIKKHQTYEEVEKGGEKTWELKTDWLEIMFERIDMQVKGWSGIVGNPKCDSACKRDLVNRKENEHICAYLIKKIAELGKAIKEEEQKKIKN